MKKFVFALTLLTLSSVSFGSVPDFKFICNANPYFVRVVQMQGVQASLEVLHKGQLIFRGAPIFEVGPNETYTFSGSTYDHIVKIDGKKMTGTYSRTYGDTPNRIMSCINLLNPI